MAEASRTQHPPHPPAVHFSDRHKMGRDFDSGQVLGMRMD